MASNPKPEHAVLKREAQRPEVNANSDAAIATVIDRLELKGGVFGIPAKQRIVLASQVLNLSRQRIEALPKAG